MARTIWGCARSAKRDNQAEIRNELKALRREVAALKQDNSPD